MSNSIYDTFTAPNGNKMYGNPVCHVYIADGFQDDCEDLIQRCVLKYDVLEYHMFCRIWKEMNMGCLYQGRTSAAEVAELSEEVLHVAKHYMVSNTTIFEESVAGLFLVYSLINLQPYQNFASLRLVPEDIPAIQRLESIARRDKRYDVLYILASVLIKGPCQFHAAERERGMEIPIKKYLDGFKSIDSVRGVRPKGVFYRQNEELDIIRELGAITKNYSEAKAEIFGPDRTDTSLQYIDENMTDELSSSLKKILNGLDEEDDDVDDENVKSERDHANAVEDIKFKAMRGAVNPLKHLTGIEDRKRLTKTEKQNPKDSAESKVSTTDTIESDTSDSKKRQPSPKGNKSKKLKINEKVTKKFITEAEINVVDVPGTLSDMTDESSCTGDEVTDWVTDDIKECAVKSLPTLINDMEYEVEIMNANDNSKTENVQPMLPDLSSVMTDSSQDEMVDDEANVSSQRRKKQKQSDKNQIQFSANLPQKLLKKTHLKSKLKRLGMLHIANLD